MDMDSDPLEECSQKVEIDSDDSDSKYAPKRDESIHWNKIKTLKLAEALGGECRLLWDTAHQMNKDKGARQAKQEYLAEMFGTTVEEISRKVHNLRCQFNFQVRKIKRLTDLGAKDAVSGWEYFDALSFLLPTTHAPYSATGTAAAARDRFDSSDRGSDSNSACLIDGVNNAVRNFEEFQEKEEKVFEVARVKPAQNQPVSKSSLDPRRHKRAIKSTPSPPMQTHTSISVSSEPHSPTTHLRADVDECQVFGDFVASELRLLRSDESRRKLKRLVQRAILKIGEEEEIN